MIFHLFDYFAIANILWPLPVSNCSEPYFWQKEKKKGEKSPLFMAKQYTIFCMGLAFNFDKGHAFKDIFQSLCYIHISDACTYKK